MGEEWKRFVKTLRPEELEALKSAGVNPDDYFDDTPAVPHRYIYGDSFADRLAFSTKKEEEETSVFGPLSSIIAKVISSFDCDYEPKVMMNNDCVRIALGYRNYKSMADVAKKYGVSKATISWRVKQVQKRLGIEPSIYMRAEETCQRLKQAAHRRKK
jgi:hypothetical protein